MTVELMFAAWTTWCAIVALLLGMSWFFMKDAIRRLTFTELLFFVVGLKAGETGLVLVYDMAKALL